MYRAGLLSGDGGDEGVSVFAENSTQPVSSEVILPTQASVDLGPAGSGRATEQPYSFQTLTTVMSGSRGGSALVTTTVAVITETLSVSAVVALETA